MFFDTHAHLNFRDYDQDREEVIKRSLGDGVLMINVGTDYQESQKVIAIAEEYERGVYASVGLHPIGGSDPPMDFDYEGYKRLAENSKVVGIGEAGLDKEGKNMQQQKEFFLQQIEIAKELDLPLIIHCRKAHWEVLEILSSSALGKKKGVIHCFTGGRKELEDYLDLGFYIGFNGIIFKMNIEKVIKSTPLNRILLETDCPFLTPPMAGRKRNEPIFVKYVAQEVARIKQISEEEVARITTENAKELFLSNLKG